MKTKEQFNKLDDEGKWQSYFFMHNHFRKTQISLSKERTKNANLKRTLKTIIKQAENSLEHEYSKR